MAATPDGSRALEYSESDDESDDDLIHNGRSLFIDDEAVESSGRGDSSSDADAESQDGLTFHYFVKLPPELRWRIWEAFCPDLVASARVLEFSIPLGPSVRHKGASGVRDGMTLGFQTQSLRRIMAVHRESRALGETAFPDTLAIDSESGDGLVRFSKRRDVVLLDGLERVSNTHFGLLPGFDEHVVHAAIPWLISSKDMVVSLVRVRQALRLFPSLQHLYCSQSCEIFSNAALRCCVSDCVHQYTVLIDEESLWGAYDCRSIICWPNVDAHPHFAKHDMPHIDLREAQLEIRKLLQESRVAMWPMVMFEFDYGIRRYGALLRSKHLPDVINDYSDPSISHQSSDSSTDLDEYESDGIDDAEIAENSDSSSSSEDYMAPGALLNGTSASLESNAPQFSSPEPDTDEASSATRGADPEPTRRLQKRKIVADSDDDDDDDHVPDEPPAKRVRAGRFVVADSDDEDSTSTTEGRSSPPPMSLVERLQLHREAHPVSPSDSEEDDDDDAAAADGRHIYGEADDRDGSDDRDCSDDAQSWNGVGDVMAAESDSDDGFDSEGG